MHRGILEGIHELSGTEGEFRGRRTSPRFHQPGRRIPSGRGDAKTRDGFEATRLLPASLAHKERDESRRDGQMR